MSMQTELHEYVCAFGYMIMYYYFMRLFYEFNEKIWSKFDFIVEMVQKIENIPESMILCINESMFKDITCYCTCVQ